jgi:hypothetical protein
MGSALANARASTILALAAVLLVCTAKAAIWGHLVAPARAQAPAPVGGASPAPALRRLGDVPMPARPAGARGQQGEAADSDGESLLVRPGEAPDRQADRDLDPDPEDEAQRRRLGERDGDASGPPPPEPIVDGIAEGGRETTAGETADGSFVDAREAEDRAAFDSPPAGYDAEAFAIEPSPILDRRPARLARLEPFDPVGLRMGSFTLFPEIEVGGLWQNNVLRSSRDPRTDVALELRPSIRVVSNWRRHALELGARATTSFHGDLSSEDDRAWALDARGRLDITRATNLELRASHDVTQEQRGSIESAGAGGERATVTTSRAQVALNHRFNRLSVQLRTGVAEATFSDGTTGGDDGRGSGGSERDYREGDVAFRATWDFKPGFAVFSEVEHVSRDHARAGGTGASENRDSAGERYRAGVSFGTRSQKLRGEVSTGWGVQRLEAAGAAPVDGILLDANVAWRPSALTTFLWTARTDLAASTAAGTSGARTYATGLEARHAFRRYLIGTAGVRFTQQEFQGLAPVEERELLLQLGAEYFLSREVSLFTRYQHTRFTTAERARNYEADEVRIGFRWRR